MPWLGETGLGSVGGDLAFHIPVPAPGPPASTRPEALVTAASPLLLGDTNIARTLPPSSLLFFHGPGVLGAEAGEEGNSSLGLFCKVFVVIFMTPE